MQRPMRRTVILQEHTTPASPAAVTGHQRLWVTPQQRAALPVRVSSIDFIDLADTDHDEVPGLLAEQSRAGAGSCYVASYDAVTPRLTRDAPAGEGDRYFFLSFVNGLRGREDDYDRWYLDHHIHEVLAAPDFVAAQRFTLAQATCEDLMPACRFMAVYELHCVDLNTSITALEAYLLSGAMTPTALKDPSRRLQVFAAPARMAS